VHRYDIFSIEKSPKTVKQHIMASTPDELSWVQQSRILSLCEISRATLNSWTKAGLDLGDKAGYDFSDLVTLLIFAAARKHMSPQHMVAVWEELTTEGEAARIVDAAERLEPDGGFDLVIDPEYASFQVTLSEAELLGAVRHPLAPRPVVVVDMAEKVRDTAAAFYRFASSEEQPEKRRRGRPRNQARLRVVGGAG
jgi:hypothetical protein